MNRPPMELDIWAGDWGLPSIDLKCLEIMTYAKFSGVTLQTKVTNSPFWSPSGSLPVFRNGNKTLCDFQEITSYLKQKNFSADFGLSPKQCAEVKAFSQLLEEQLLPGLQFMWWVDTKNYINFSRPWYAKALPLPFNYYYPGRYEREANDMMDTLFDKQEQLSVKETGVYKEAERCLTALTVRLGNNDFFFGAHPCSLDSTVYAYLAPLLKAPLPSAALQNHLKACPNLVKFVNRISQRYYPHIAQDYEKKRLTEETEKAKKEAETDGDFPNKTRNQVFAGVFATVAMAGYAFATGLIEISPKDFGDSADDYDEIIFDGHEDDDSE